MVKRILVSAFATLLLSAIGLATPAFAQAMKTASVCGDEYKTQKAALKAAKETKKDFIASCRVTPIGTATQIGGSVTPTTAPAAPTSGPASRTSTASGLKTASACDDEYKADKAALKAAKEKKKDFMAACRALPPGTPTPVAGAAPTPTAPAPMPTAPASQPTAAPAPTPYRAPTSMPSATGTPTGAHQFPDEGSAKAHCPSATVVWVNTKSGVSLRGQTRLRAHEARCLHVRERGYSGGRSSCKERAVGVWRSLPSARGNQGRKVSGLMTLVSTPSAGARLTKA